ncbi:tyrosine-type recombinase/integrase [Streptomyces sp. BRB081]|nr:tyrosine-type recombinase/integrase [Streptomyces sp. BRB081]
MLGHAERGTAQLAHGAAHLPGHHRGDDQRRQQGQDHPRGESGFERELGFHALRHTFASAQLDAGESVVSVSKWMGHSSPEITLKIYAHFMPEADGRGRAIMQKWLDF